MPDRNGIPAWTSHVEWTGTTFRDFHPPLPPATETGTKEIIITPAWVRQGRCPLAATLAGRVIDPSVARPGL